MKNIRRALLTSALAIAACGFASAGTITQTFNLPSGSSTTNWTSTNASTLNYLAEQATCVATCGNLQSVSIAYSWSSTNTVNVTDNNPGSTGTDTFFLGGDTSTTLKNTSGGAIIALSENTALGTPDGNGNTGCSTTFTNQSLNQVMNTNCVETNGVQAGDGAVLSSGVQTSGAIYNFFLGASAGNLSFTGTGKTAVLIQGPGGGTNASFSGAATESVTVTYNYAAPVTGVPEPATMFLMGSALIGVGLLRKRSKA